MTEENNTGKTENLRDIIEPFLSENDVKSTGEEFEEVINATGGLGRFQVLVILFTCGSKTAVSWAMLLMTFGGKIPDWWCLDSSNTTAPLLKTCDINGTTCVSVRYSDELVTVVSQFGLICDKKQLSALISSIQLCGVLIGSLCTGQVAELFGRKKVFFSVIALVVVLCTCSALIETWEAYAAMRFFIGGAIGGVLVLDTGIPVEFMPSKWRTCLAGIPAWDTGSVLFALVAYLTRNWKYMSIATGVATAPFLLGLLVVPESMRWLLARGKMDEVKTVVTKMARINGKKCPDLIKLEEAAKVEFRKQEKKNKQYSYLDLLKRWNMAKMSLPIVYMWAAMGLTYYGISFGVVALSGDLYLNLFISGVVPVPGKLIVVYTINKFGRKWSVGGAFVISGLAASTVVLVSYLDLENRSAIIAGLAMTSKFATGTAWGAIKLYTAEMFPTVVRNLGLGLGNVAARVGGIIAPQLIYLSQLNGSIMYLILGISMIISALLTITLPETKGQAIQDMIEVEAKVPSVKYQREAKEDACTINKTVP